MSLKNLSTTPGSNTLAPPYGAPESSTKIKDYNDLWRYLASVVRHFAAPVTIASAATTDLGASDETIQTISGITTITSFGTVSAGIWKLVTFSGALTLTHNATSLILLGGANRTTVAGDCGLYVSLGSGNWKEYFFSPIGAYQPLDAQLTTLAGITAQQAADLGALSAFMGTVLNDADAATARATLGAKSATLDNVFSAVATINQTVVAGTFTKVEFNVEVHDLSNTFLNHRFTPNVAGYYQFNFSVAGNTNVADGTLIGTLYKNGERIRDGSRSRAQSLATLVSTGSCVLYLNGTTDFVEVYASISGALLTPEGSWDTCFSGFRVG